MGWRAWVKCAVGVALALSVVIEVRAKQPVFVSWLVADDPGDQTILHYWERYELEELSPNEKVDLGTMLFYRGYPKDAVRVLESALDQDEELNEAWFRIGLVEHQQGDLREARIAYKRCLKLFKGHGWCNFYLGLLEEQDGHGKKAMEYYRAAFHYAPVLADREVNPEMASSDLTLGAWLMMAHDDAFKKALPMPYLHPKRVERIKTGFAGEIEQSNADKKAKKRAKRNEKKNGTVEKVGGSGTTARLVPVTTATKTSKSKPPQTQPKPGPRKAEPGKTVKPPPPGASEDETPWGLPGNRNVSSDAYPGF